jgi:hypothetical protein
LVGCDMMMHFWPLMYLDGYVTDVVH